MLGYSGWSWPESSLNLVKRYKQRRAIVVCWWKAPGVWIQAVRPGKQLPAACLLLTAFPRLWGRRSFGALLAQRPRGNSPVSFSFIWDAPHPQCILPHHEDALPFWVRGQVNSQWPGPGHVFGFGSQLYSLVDPMAKAGERWFLERSVVVWGKKKGQFWALGLIDSQCQSLLIF